MSILREIRQSTATGQVATNNRATNRQVRTINRQTNRYINSLTKLNDQQNDQLTRSTEQSILGTRQQYQKAYDYNAINQQLQQDQVAERMADMGLSNSGLNMTNQTALAVSRINSDNAVTQSYNNAVNTLRSNLQALIAQNNRELASNVAGIRYDNAMNIANLRAQNRKENANIISNWKNNAKSIRQKLIGAITSTSDKGTNAQTIYSYAKTYGLSEDSVKRLLKMANISWDDYNSWIDNRNFFDRAPVVSSSRGYYNPNPNPGDGGDEFPTTQTYVGGTNYNNALMTVNMHYRSPDGTVMSASSVQNYIDGVAQQYNLTGEEKDAIEEVITDRYDVR